MGNADKRRKPMCRGSPPIVSREQQKKLTGILLVPLLLHLNHEPPIGVRGKRVWPE
ncbi:hypothetical protein OOU_Y34scaffold00192g13 [Pyricularia oryzae Y34]|uniref:Uncharacterized protein n=2 Tax=Pyricularia oryzae TaxID=318829 RepID=A0AA97P6A0_PYRO3|nr:hypothetical protein OOU_Y34scaffold00192g13 [Pyricularia oryzae Y34]